MPQRRLEKIPDDQVFAEWVEWVKRVYDETVHLAWNRRVFREMRMVFAKNPLLQDRGGFLWAWVQGNYVAGAAMSLRRELDRQAGTLNLAHLLFEIEKRPTVISRRRYYERWGPLDHDFQSTLRDHSFNLFQLIRFPDDPMRDHIDPVSVKGDRKELERQTEVVREYVEQTIAHRSRGTPETITFKEFHAALDAITPIFKRYYALLTISSVAQVEPVPQFNTHEPFTFPWDVVCCELWQECMKGRRLDWQRIHEAYRDDTAENDRAEE